MRSSWSPEVLCLSENNFLRLCRVYRVANFPKFNFAEIFICSSHKFFPQAHSPSAFANGVRPECVSVYGTLRSRSEIFRASIITFSFSSFSRLLLIWMCLRIASTSFTRKYFSVRAHWRPALSQSSSEYYTALRIIYYIGEAFLAEVEC